ncbi:hypothetical protein EHS25_003599 [Saitozyma podzolica]|uniref:Acyl-CoA desaturase n=1 Tax=Saitozyma podzolica TaxID=1890683 RepID=A0A427Y7P9_9TREE|nr:hypothetical protein EHS25_003599 [Saitozyma podzolica]
MSVTSNLVSSVVAEQPALGERMFKAREKRNQGEIWWSNGIFFVAMHIFALAGAAYLSPPTKLDWRTALLFVTTWQLANFGITIGYHRLWSHRAFTAATPLRAVLAAMGSMGFQGSIKWWVLRHRLHHRWTDSPVHDPYAATNGLWWAHCGWIFRKPIYPRMKLIERADLEADPVVRFQHKHYIPIALFSGLVLPTLIASLGWGDTLGGFVWGGVMGRLATWHCTFCINSLAHWTGLQPYTEEVTARGNLLLALLTSGEGNHNFHHAFPKDFRNGPHPADWDPSKWAIYLLHKYTPLIPSIARTPESAVLQAQARVHIAQADRLVASVSIDETAKPIESLPVWSREEVRKRHGEWVASKDGERRRRVLLVLEGCVVDAGGYIDDHPGGEQLLLANCVRPLRRLPSIPFDPLSPDLPRSSSPLIDSGYSSDTPSLSDADRADGAARPLFHRTTSAISSVSSDEGGVSGDPEVALRDATRVFFGGMNNHSVAARERMRSLRVARLAAE